MGQNTVFHAIGGLPEMKETGKFKLRLKIGTKVGLLITILQGRKKTVTLNISPQVKVRVEVILLFYI